MDRTNDAFKELVNHVSQESNALSRESLISMENMNSTIGAQSANSVAAVAREFGNLVLVDHTSKVPLVPEVGALIGNALASVAATTALIASTQEKGRKQEESMKTHSSSGINDLIAVTQMKNSNANEQALNPTGAYDYGFSTVLKDEGNVWDAEYVYVGPTTEDYSDKYSESTTASSHYSNSWSDLLKASENSEIPEAARKTSFSWDKLDNYTKVNRMKPITTEWRKVKDDEGDDDDKLGTFSIQNLMSDYNQAEALASSVAKKSDDTKSSVLGKI